MLIGRHGDNPRSEIADRVHHWTNGATNSLGTTGVSFSQSGQSTPGCLSSLPFFHPLTLPDFQLGATANPTLAVLGPRMVERRLPPTARLRRPDIRVFNLQIEILQRKHRDDHHHSSADRKNSSPISHLHHVILSAPARQLRLCPSTHHSPFTFTTVKCNLCSVTSPLPPPPPIHHLAPGYSQPFLNSAPTASGTITVSMNDRPPKSLTGNTSHKLQANKPAPSMVRN